MINKSSYKRPHYMNKFYIGMQFFVAVFLASGCSSNVNNYNENENKDPQLEYDYFYANSQIIPTEENLPPKGMTSGNARSSTNNKCMDNYNFLKEEKSYQYDKYSGDYNKITEGFKFLNSNKNIMDADAKKIYTMDLKMKLETLCSKIQYSSFILVNDKRKSLSGI